MNKIEPRHIVWLDAHRGQDLILTVAAFRQAFYLTEQQANQLVTEWMRGDSNA